MSLRLKVLLSAYACQPNKGSEPGAGWNWAVHLSKYVDVTVLTRTNNRLAIEKELKESHYSNISFVYYDLPKIFLKLKRISGTWIYYFFWQFGVYFYLKKHISKKQFDIVHHVTFMSNKLNVMPFLGLKNVVGPVGGLELLPSRFIGFTGHPFQEFFRNLLILRYKYSPFYTHYLSKINRLILTNSSNKTRLNSRFLRKISIMQIGSKDFHYHEKIIKNTQDGDELNIYWGGILSRWKGLEFLLLALLKIDIKYKLVITGRGKDKNYFKKLVYKLKLQDVYFKGWVDEEELNEIKNTCDVFVFTSLRETTGSILLEMMARGKPSIVVDIGGSSEIADNTTSIKIKACNKDQIISDMQQAIKNLAIDNDLRNFLGINAAHRIDSHFDWDDKAKQMVKIYEEVLNENPASS